jgi:hypothetical protein
VEKIPLPPNIQQFSGTISSGTSEVCEATGATSASVAPTQQPVPRSSELLRPHPAFDQIGWRDTEDLNRVARRNSQLVREPLRITKQGIILSGVGEWELAVFERKPYVYCIEYDLDNNQALQFILACSGARKGLNDFVRLRLALTLEDYLRAKGRENMSAAGKHKGLTNSPNFTPIDVRRWIAELAGTGTGNVDKVRTILQKAPANIIRALQEGSLRIHRAWTWCNLSKTDQLKAFNELEEGLAMRKTARKINKTGVYPSFTIQQILQSLERLETSHPGQVRVRRTERRETVVLVGSDLINEIQSRGHFDGFN